MSPRPRVAIVYNEPGLPDGHPDALAEADVMNVARAVESALGGTEFDPILAPAGPPLSSFVTRLEGLEADIVFSLIEGFGGRSELATHVTSIYELLGIPYTGAAVEGLVACLSKGRAKALLRAAGLPATPSLIVLPDDPIPVPDGPGPWIVKPDAEDGSLGIDQESVVNDGLALSRRVELLRSQYRGAVLIEPYLPGPEFNVGLIADPAPRALPVAQVMFANRAGHWPILTYAAKWDEGSAEDLASPVVCPAPIDPALAEALATIAVAAFRETGCRDYARVDFRLDAGGRPWILEVNPNPDLNPGAGWSRAAKASGLDHAEAVARIAWQAWMRGDRATDKRRTARV